MYIHFHDVPSNPHPFDAGMHAYGQSPYSNYGFQRVRLEHNILRGGILISMIISRKFESTNLSRDNLSREIGRTRTRARVRAAVEHHEVLGLHVDVHEALSVQAGHDEDHRLCYRRE